MTPTIFFWLVVSLLVVIALSLAVGGYKLIKAALDDDSESRTSGMNRPQKRGPSGNRRARQNERKNRSHREPAFR